MSILYYHILKTTYAIDVSQMFIYSTHIDSKAEKVYEVAINTKKVDRLVNELDSIAFSIIRKDFSHDKYEVDKKLCNRLR